MMMVSLRERQPVGVVHGGHGERALEPEELSGGARRVTRDSKRCLFHAGRIARATNIYIYIYIYI